MRTNTYNSLGEGRGVGFYFIVHVIDETNGSRGTVEINICDHETDSLRKASR